MPAYRSIEQRFSEKYVVRDSGCWEWTAVRVRGGYGMIGGGPKRQNQLAHRVSYELKFGSIPSGMIVSHKCDNPSCVNPDHLQLADHLENMRDMALKGRAKKMTYDNIGEACAMLEIGYSRKEVAEKFGVHPKTLVASILRDSDSPATGVKSLAGYKYTKLTAEQRQKIVEMLSTGIPILHIAGLFNVDRKTVRNIRDKL